MDFRQLKAIEQANKTINNKKNKSIIFAIILVIVTIIMLIFETLYLIEKQNYQTLQQNQVFYTEEYMEIFEGILDCYQDNILNINNEQQNEDVQALIMLYTDMFRWIAGGIISLEDADFEEIVLEHSPNLYYLLELFD